MQIAFIGLGNMGGPMAINLHKAGHTVKAFDLSKDACAKVAAEGLAIAASAEDAVQGAEAVVSMLPASQHVEGLFLGRDGTGGLLQRIAKGALIIDSSTIAAATSQKVAKAAQAAGIAFIDAPVSGGTGGAIAGTLTFMVGGSDADLERPRLQELRRRLRHRPHAQGPGPGPGERHGRQGLHAPGRHGARTLCHALLCRPRRSGFFKRDPVLSEALKARIRPKSLVTLSGA
jgi:3-hydroxyisobutyrate dehydrogenase-like beta-hydroxyacid dehydrogenase